MKAPLVAALAAASCAAWADDPNPYYIGATQTLTHDSNVFRTPNGSSDNYGSTGLVAGFNQPIGRQQLRASATVNNNYYQRETSLNNVSYAISAGWDLSTIERLSGGVSASASRSLASNDFNSTAQPAATRNIITRQQIGARVGWGGDGPLGLNAAYSHSNTDYSESPTSEARGDSASFGATYRLGPTVRLGLGVSALRNEAPFGIVVSPGVYESNTTNGRSLDFTASWQPGPRTGLNGRLSWTRNSNSRNAGQDFSGLTGALGASYEPSAKISLSASLSRDAGTSATLTNQINPSTGLPFTVSNNNTRTTDSLSLGASYAATARIGVTAGLLYRSSDVADQIGLGGAAVNSDRTDKSYSASLGANWAIARNWSLGCNLNHVKREISGSTPIAYSSNVASCTAQLTLR